MRWLIRESVVHGQLLVVFSSIEGDIMARTNFEKLRVYQLSEQLADLIWDIVFEWNSFARDTVGKQLVKAADSIGANISEGTGRGSYVDNRVCQNCQGFAQRNETLATKGV